jgi:hypothetical protein
MLALVGELVEQLTKLGASGKRQGSREHITREILPRRRRESPELGLFLRRDPDLNLLRLRSHIE